MAKGGHVTYCSETRAHKPECEYYADGGEIVPDAEIAPPETANTEQQPVEASQPEPMPDAPITEPEITPDAPVEEPSEGPGLGEHVLAGAEGVAQGVLGPAATYIETHPTAMRMLGPVGKIVDMFYRPTKDELASRSELPSYGAGQAAGLIGSMLSGVGEAGLIAKGTKALTPEGASLLGKIGSGALKSALDTGLVQTGNELSDSMLGKGDPNTPVASALSHVGGAGLLGAITGGVFGAGEKGIEKLAATKVGKKMSEFLSGIGAANIASKAADTSEIPSELQEALENGSSEFKAGMKLHNLLTDPQYLGSGALKAAATGVGYREGGLPGGLAGEILEEKLGPVLEKIIGKPLSTASKRVVIPTMLKMFSEGASPSEALEGANYAMSVGAGAAKLNRAVESLFKTGDVLMAPVASEAKRTKLKKFIEDGEFQKQIDASNAPNQEDQPAYAEGGEVSKKREGATPILQGTDYLAKHYPSQNIILQQAKGRINDYLNNSRPLDQPKLPFDKAPKSAHQDRSYDSALDIANEPLSVLHSIKNHTISPEHIKHINGLHPEVYKELSKKLTEKISEHQIEGKNIPYKLRQSLSVFMGAPLDSTMTAQGLQAIQSTFMGKGPADQSQPEKAPSSSSMKGVEKLPSQYQTPSEARAARAQRLK